jgi:hypothetical protein
MRPASPSPTTSPCSPCGEAERARCRSSTDGKEESPGALLRDLCKGPAFAIDSFAPIGCMAEPHVIGGRLRIGAAVHGYLPRLSAEYPPDHQPIRRSTFATACGAHLPPRAVPMPRPFSAAAICRSVFAPAAWASRMAGATLPAKASAPAVWFALAIARASASLGLARRRRTGPDGPSRTGRWRRVGRRSRDRSGLARPSRSH